MRKKTIPIFIIFIVIAINLFFGFPRVEKYTAVDETHWSYDRVPKFWKSIKKGNWKGTSLCDKPGITLAAISGLGLPFIPDPQDYEKDKSQPKSPEKLEIYKNIYFALRLPVYFFSLLSLPFFFFFIRRLWNEKIALLSVIFIGLSPILLGISLIVNTDAILWILMPLSLISFMVYQKEGNKKFLYASAVILGFSILNKFVSNLLFPFFIALIFLKYIFSDFSKEEGIRYFKNSLKDYLILIMVSIATILIFYPNAWIKPIKSLLDTTILSMAFEKIWPIFSAAVLFIILDVFLFKAFVSRAISDPFKKFNQFFLKIVSGLSLLLIAFIILNVFQEMKYFDFQSLFFMPKTDIADWDAFKINILSAFAPLIFGLAPIASLSFISAVILLAINRKTDRDSTILFFSLLLFIMVFYTANSLVSISSTVRYQIVVYPIASIIAAVGLFEIINSQKLKKYFSGYRFFILLGAIIGLSIYSLRSVQPFFLAYSSDFFPKKYLLFPRDMGDGSWEASEYLNKLKDAENLIIWTDKKQVCEKFSGKCETAFDRDVEYDYLVASRGGETETREKSKDSAGNKIGLHSVDIQKIYDEDEYFDHLIVINDRPRDFIKIVRPGLVSQ